MTLLASCHHIVTIYQFIPQGGGIEDQAGDVSQASDNERYF